MNRRLVAIAGPATGTTYELEDGAVLVIGRGSDSDTQIDDARMSRIHCRVIVDGDKTTVSDAGSSSGTLVAGQPIEQAVLQPGDEILVGSTRLRYEIGEAGAVAREGETMGPPASDTPPAGSPADAAGLTELAGKELHGFRLDEILAMGNTGIVYKGMELERDRPCAIKVMPPGFATSEDEHARFVRAMKTMMPIKHDHIVEIYNAGRSGPYCWVAMQLVEGESLTEVIQRSGVDGMLDWREVWRVAVQIGRGLHEASKHQIIHRNLTPNNILRRESDRACLLGDLMLAKALEGSLAVQITRPGQMIGEIPYMSPERTRGTEDVDTRSDIYGLGATLYALLTGRAPVEGKSLPELVQNARETVPAAPKDFQLSIEDSFQDAVMRMLEKDPDRRYQTADQLLRELHRIGKFHSLQADWTGWTA